MKTFIIAGSNRKDSETARVGQYFADTITKKNLGEVTGFLDLGKDPLPMWDEGVWDEKDKKWSEKWSPIEKKLEEADSFVILSPEWGGMVTPALRNFFLLASGTKAMGHKPVVLGAVSAARGGAYPIAEMRMSGYKNSQMCYIPEHIIVRDVGSTLKGDAPANEADAYIRERIEYSLKLLKEYSTALTKVRNAGVLDYEKYANGM